MINLGKYNDLLVMAKERSYFVLEDNIKLPINDDSNDLQIGDKINAFVYNDEKKGKLATLSKVLGSVGDVVQLKIIGESNMGYFLDLNMPKDVLLLSNKVRDEVNVGDTVIVYLYLDNKNRIAANMHISQFLLEADESIKVGAWVDGTVYSFSGKIGAFIVVNGKYDGMIHKNKLSKRVKVGDKVKAKVLKINNEKKYELSLRDLAHKEIDNDSKKILTYMRSTGGMLILTDDSHPNDIKRELNMSKKSFKKAVGKLYKDQLIYKDNDRFYIK